MILLLFFSFVIFGLADSSDQLSLTRQVSEDVVLMFNVSTSILEVLWGIRDGATNNLNPGLITADISTVRLTPTPDYAGRVSFVGNLSKGHAWFKITNLNINDTNQYLAKIRVQGSSSYDNIPAQLTIILPVITTPPPTTREASLSSLATQHTTTVLTTNPPTITNLTTYLKVDEKFSKEMKNQNSPNFNFFSNEFEMKIQEVYNHLQDSNFKSVSVVKLSEGSILVDFIVFFESEIKYDKACAPLEKAIEDGKLGNFKIVPGSLGCSKKKPSPPSPPGSRTGVHPGIIAGVAVVGVLAIAGLIIAVLFVCRKKSSRKDYRSSTGGQGYEIDARYGEPEEQYASVQRPTASGGKQSNDPQLPQYAAVDKSKKTKKKTEDPNELVYADLDHNASMDMRPPSVQRPDSGSDTVYADIQSGRQKPQYPPPQYGNILDISHA